jgi:hypothetical protein
MMIPDVGYFSLQRDITHGSSRLCYMRGSLAVLKKVRVPCDLRQRASAPKPRGAP